MSASRPDPVRRDTKATKVSSSFVGSASDIEDSCVRAMWGYKTATRGCISTMMANSSATRVNNAVSSSWDSMGCTSALSAYSWATWDCSSVWWMGKVAMKRRLSSSDSSASTAAMLVKMQATWDCSWAMSASRATLASSWPSARDSLSSDAWAMLDCRRATTVSMKSWANISAMRDCSETSD